MGRSARITDGRGDGSRNAERDAGDRQGSRRQPSCTSNGDPIVGDENVIMTQTSRAEASHERLKIIRQGEYDGADAEPSGRVGPAQQGRVDMTETTTPLGPIIDVHAHALLPVWLKAIQALFGDRPLSIAGAAVPHWSAQEHLAVMDQNAIAASILSWPGAASFFKGQAAKDLARTMNEAFAALVAQHPGRFGAFAVVPVDDIDIALEEAAYALDVLKLDGLALTTNAGGHYLGDPYFDPLLEEMHRRGATLFVHPGSPPGFDLAANGLNVAILEFMFDSTRMAVNMVLSGAKAKYDRLNIICTHGGGTLPYLAHRIGILEPLFGAGHGRPTLSREAILGGLASFHYDLTAATSAAQLDAMRRLVPASRLLMGFDYPMMPAAEIAPSKALLNAFDGMSDEDKSRITRENAVQLFPRLRTAALGGA
jgi:6-methylsalicylate decarboxylase